MKLQTKSERLEALPPYIFAELDRKKAELAAKGEDLINLGIGDPELPPPPKIIEALKEGLKNPEFHRYPAYEGADFFREEISRYLRKFHDINADPEKEVLTLIGSKEGLSHLPVAITNPGDKILITNPGYPAHYHSIIISGGRPELIEIKEENNFLPELGKIPDKIFKNAKLFFLNYPNNPTGATATAEFFKEVVKLAHKYNFIICQDSAYINISLDGTKQPTLLSLPGAKEVAVEFFSLSKMFNICGWRLGFCAGNSEVISSLKKLKNSVDSGQFTAIQWAGTVALRECIPDIPKTLEVYKTRKNILCEGLKKMGLKYFNSSATFYVWVKTPNGIKSEAFTTRLMEELGVIATPGLGFGSAGDGYIRFSLTAPTERITEATERMKGLSSRA